MTDDGASAHPPAAGMNPKNRDIRLELISLLGLTTAVVILAFAVFRLSRGEYAAMAVDAAIAATVLGVVIYARTSGNSLRAGNLLCLLNSSACLLAAWLIGPEALTWLYLVLLTNFFLADRRLALAAGLAMLVVLCLLPHIFDTPFHAVSTLATAALTALFSYIFATRSQDDRVELQELASLDALTNVPNRRMMEKALAQAVEQRRQGRGQYGLIVLDLDRFKDVNDQYGHAAGDNAIADLASILRFEMRKDDHVFRFGGEEFVVLLRVANGEELEAATERLRKAVRTSLRGPGGRITISLGGALLGHERDWHDWFSRADAALYRAKSNGRDNYVIAEDLF